MITASSNPKFFSNGLDLDWRRGEGDGNGGDKLVFGDEFFALMARLITFPLPTICAVNGHGFGAGFMLALSHGIRLMRADRGYLCANEIQIGMAIPAAERIAWELRAACKPVPGFGHPLHRPDDPRPLAC